jgi:tetratricopeptide (TPR) repeat protein
MAWQLASGLMPQAREHAGIHYIAGVACLELGRAAQAAALLQHASTLEPARTSFAIACAKALMLAGDREAAVAEADRIAEGIDDPSALDTLGMVYALAQAHEKAAAMLRRAVAASPDNALCRFTLATTLIFLGDTAGAETALEECLRVDPHYWKAYLALSQLNSSTLPSKRVGRLEAMLAQPAGTAPEASIFLNLALAKEYEDLADYPRAFTHLCRGKQAAGSSRHYASAQDRQLFACLGETAIDAEHEAGGDPTREPIFVIGMPRSGTTLVDRILSSHADVQSAGELMNFAVSVKRQSGSTTPALIDPDTVARSRHLDWRALAERYLASTRPATGRQAHFVDKLPHNFLYAGHIAKAFPQAKIICLRRDPMDTCLSNFRQLFAPNAPFFGYSYDLLDTGRYYLLFDRLMAHWQQVFPGRILEVDYESLVNAQEATSRKLLAFCDLEWDEACLRFETNAAAVVTASAVQVRSGIYHDAMNRWKRYGSQVEPLHRLLVEAGVVPPASD